MQSKSRKQQSNTPENQKSNSHEAKVLQLSAKNNNVMAPMLHMIICMLYPQAEVPENDL